MPPPPDDRRVVFGESQEKERNIQLVEQLRHIPVVNEVGTSVVPEKQQERPSLNNKLEISCANTTLIGDYISTIFPEYQRKWLVQASGNATFASVLAAIQEGLITVDRRYVFFQLGGNQIRTASADSMFENAVKLVTAVRDRKLDARIFFIGILPRPVDNEFVKPLIMKANRWMAHAVDRIQKMFQKVRFLPVQLAFIEGSVPKQQLFDAQDQHTLNLAGAALFRAKVFKLAGFVQNF